MPIYWEHTMAPGVRGVTLFLAMILFVAPAAGSPNNNNLPSQCVHALGVEVPARWYPIPTGRGA